MLRSTLMYNMPGSCKSSVYVACPVISRGSSRRLMRVPTILGVMGIVASLQGLEIKDWGLGGKNQPLVPSAQSLLRRVLHCLHNMLISGTAAQVTFQSVADFCFGRIWVAL